jgi:pyrimidine operon attenuation protein/uracil phosphoribosyltransferase
MGTNKLSILDSNEIAEKTTRIAFQILEDNFEESSLVFAGVADRG